jgi:hypothetical protein
VAVERVTDASLWVRLAWNAIHVIRQDANLPRLEHYWVEDFIPDRPLAVEDGAIRGMALIMEHQDAGKGFSRYAMTVRLGERALGVFARGEGYESLVPDEARTDWLALDTTTKHVTISLD